MGYASRVEGRDRKQRGASPIESDIQGAAYFRVDPIFLRSASALPYQRRPADPLYRPLRIFALDPAASRLEGAIATVNVPFEELRPGPRGVLLEVMDRDETTGAVHPPVDLNDPRVLITNGRDPSLSDVTFHQQMVYAVCSLTYDAFRNALGRDIVWGFEARSGDGPAVLRIRPHAFEMENAFFDPRSGELNFGYYRASDEVHGRNLPHGVVYTCLSHDIVAHEMTHALLDGLRAHFRLPTNPDVLAFHEGFADLIAIFSRFSYPEVVHAAVERSLGSPEKDALLLSVAMQFGQTTRQAGPLRSAIDPSGFGSDSDSKPRRYEEAGPEPHDLGSVLVSAVFEAFGTVFRRKTRLYRRLAGSAAPSAELVSLLTKAISGLASQFLSICIRAIDYCPPIDLRLGEYLRALITADYNLVPDDPYAYREALIDAFARRGIYPEGVASLSEDCLLWKPPERRLEPIEPLHFGNLRFAGDPARVADEEELRRQAEALGAYVMRPETAWVFGCALPDDPALNGDKVEPAVVSSVRSLRKVGPNQEVSFELVAEVTQRRWLKNDGLACEFYGGCTIVIGPMGDIRYLIRKRVNDERRAAAQLKSISTRGGDDSSWEERGQRLCLRRNGLQELHKRVS